MSDEGHRLVRGFVAEQGVVRGMIASGAYHDIRFKKMKRQTEGLTETNRIHRQIFARIWTACPLGGLADGLIVAIVDVSTL